MSSNNEKIAYQGKILEVVEQEKQIGEKTVTFEFARRSPGTRLIIPMQAGNILLTKEFRTELDGYDMRLPGGKVFDTLVEYNAALASGADIAAAATIAAKKEALEEAGIEISEMSLFGISKCGATVEWDLYYFVAEKFEQVGRQDSGEGEDIQNLSVSREEAREMCLDGRMQEERSALMLLRYLRG